jgi:hypothetical protein
VTLKRYALIVLGAVAATLAAAWPALPAQTRPAVLCGAALAACNTVLAYVIAVWSMRRSPNVFLGMVLGGMVGRMGLMLGAFVACVMALGLPSLPLAVAVLAYFVAFLVFELTVLHRLTSTPARAR